jgi:hypothetical protein
MKDYSMSDDLFRQRAIEEDGCMITAVGAGLASAMDTSAVNVSLHQRTAPLVPGEDPGRPIPIGERSLPEGPSGTL